MDMEKVIKALECCKRKDGNECKVCPYAESDFCVEDMVTDTFDLLKEQEAVVRCKDCKFGFSEYGYVFCTKPYVEKGSANHKPDWFCADGVKKDG